MGAFPPGYLQSHPPETSPWRVVRLVLGWLLLALSIAMICALALAHPSAENYFVMVPGTIGMLVVALAFLGATSKIARWWAKAIDGNRSKR